MSLGPPNLDTMPTFPITSPLAKFPFPNLELPIDDPLPPIQSKKTKQELASTYNWDRQLEEPGFIAVPVSCFKHVSSSAALIKQAPNLVLAYAIFHHS